MLFAVAGTTNGRRRRKAIAKYFMVSPLSTDDYCLGDGASQVLGTSVASMTLMTFLYVIPLTMGRDSRKSR